MTRRLLPALLMTLGAASALRAQFDLPVSTPPAQYGNVLMDRGSKAKGEAPVSFSHWLHRQRYTCRVCHTELGFSMKRNDTGVSEEANRKGNFCGACHNGQIAFGHTEGNCGKCHGGDGARGNTLFGKLGNLPRAKFGNGIDWAAAFDAGLIKPAQSLAGGYRPMTYDGELVLEAEWSMVPPAVFSHKAHLNWLDCSNCHPAIFNIEKKTTQHFSMEYNLKGQFCGACHQSVAFPLNDCRRCHPQMEGF